MVKENVKQENQKRLMREYAILRQKKNAEFNLKKELGEYVETYREILTESIRKLIQNKQMNESNARRILREYELLKELGGVKKPDDKSVI